MGKYIIDIEHEDMIVNRHLIILIEVGIQGNDEKLKIGCELTNDLIPYTEPDMKQVRKEAYENGYGNGFADGHLKAEKSGQSFYEDGYKRGLNDAWEAARKITGSVMDGCFNYNELNVLFGSKYPESIINKYSASECIEKIRQYEQRQDRKAKIEYNFEEVKDVIETTAKEYNMSLDEISAILEKMRETE